MKNFKQLHVWQVGMKIAAAAFRFAKTLPAEERFGLCSQITRAAMSVPSNIAEGSSRSSEKDYRRFLEIALGSCFELETLFLIAQTSKYGSEELRAALLEDVVEEQKMLSGFILRLKS